MCLRDAFDDREAKADTFVVGTYAVRAALKWLGKRRHHLWGELLAGALDGELHAFCVGVCRDPEGAVKQKPHVEAPVRRNRAAAQRADYLKGTVTGPGTLENTAMKSRSSGVR